MTRAGTVVLALCAVLAGCAPRPTETAPPPVLPRSEPDLCGAGRQVSLIGQDGTALERVLLLGQVRVIRPGDAVTMDLRPERINFEIAEDGRIVRVFCG